jgi:hypothetical protein
VWIGNQPNASTGPTALPIPTGIAFTPSNPSLSHTAPDGTTIATVTVTMSDGSTFSGTLAVGLDNSGNQTARASGTTRLVTNGSPLLQVPTLEPVTATQSGNSFATIVDMQVS